MRGSTQVPFDTRFLEDFGAALDLFRPPTFRLDQRSNNYHDHCRFPFLEDSFHSRGSFGEVRKIVIHPDYLDDSVAEVMDKYTTDQVYTSSMKSNVSENRISLHFVLAFSSLYFIVRFCPKGLEER